MTKAQEKAAQALANRRDAYAKKVSGLLHHIGLRSYAKEMGAAFDAGTDADTFAATIAAREPVGAAVHAVKAEAMDHAEVQLRLRIDKVLGELADHGNDVDAYAPHPGYRSHGHQAEMAKAKHNFVHSITQDRDAGSYRRHGEPHFRVGSPDRVEALVAQARSIAAGQYDAFICKLVGKVGPGAKSATLEGSHVWGSSILTVEMADGTAQRWHTQQIVNTSVLGNPYYQWPTRLMK